MDDDAFEELFGGVGGPKKKKGVCRGDRVDSQFHEGWGPVSGLALEGFPGQGPSAFLAGLVPNAPVVGEPLSVSVAPVAGADVADCEEGKFPSLDSSGLHAGLKPNAFRVLATEGEVGSTASLDDEIDVFAGASVPTGNMMQKLCFPKR